MPVPTKEFEQIHKTLPNPRWWSLGTRRHGGGCGRPSFFLALLERLFFAACRCFTLMRLRAALVLASAISVFGMSAHANQMFPAGGNSGTACPSGSQYKGSGFCKAKKPDYQFFHAGGSSAFLPQWVLIQRECFLPNSLTCRTWGSCGKPLFFVS